MCRRYTINVSPVWLFYAHIFRNVFWNYKCCTYSVKQTGCRLLRKKAVDWEQGVSPTEGCTTRQHPQPATGDTQVRDCTFVSFGLIWSLVNSWWSHELSPFAPARCWHNPPLPGVLLQVCHMPGQLVMSYLCRTSVWLENSRWSHGLPSGMTSGRLEYAGPSPPGCH